MTGASVLDLHGISKRYGPVQALRGVDFSLRSGEVHALLGENGAGKTTLMQITYGLVPLDAGEIRFRDRPVAIRSPREARDLGIGMVHQHFTSVPALTVRENIALALGPRRWKEAGSLEGAGLFAGLGEGLDSEARVEQLSVGLKQRLEIVKALAADARILLLDEPTAVLAPAEVDALLRAVGSFAWAGGAVVLITHQLREVFAAADRLTVLRGELQGQTETNLAEAMVGGQGRTEAAMPLLLAALGELVVERSGVINLGIEGSMLGGALAGAVGASAGGVWLGAGASVLGGLALALVFALAAIGFRADQILAGTAITLWLGGTHGGPLPPGLRRRRVPDSGSRCFARWRYRPWGTCPWSGRPSSASRSRPTRRSSRSR